MTKPNLMENLSNGLGALVWYDLTGTRITPDRMRALLASEGLDTAIVPDIDPESAVRRAVRAFSEGRGEFRATVGADDDDVLVVNILRKQRTGSRKVEYLLHDSGEWSKVSRTWNLAPLSEQGIRFAQIVDDYTAHLDHEWIRPRLIHSALSAMQSFSLRRQGGVYFVASSHMSDLERLARIVSQIGGSNLSIAHVEATASSQASIGNAARESIESTLSALVDRLDEWTESARKTSPSAIGNALAELADLRSRADLYSDALSVALGDLATKIDEASETARAMIESDGVIPNPSTVATLVALIAEHGGEDASKIRIPGEAVLAAGETMGFAFWRDRVGFASAASLGYRSRVSTKGGTMSLLLTENTPESVEEPEEPEEVETVEVDVEAEERAADVRESLSRRTPEEVATAYAEIVGGGEAPPVEWSKARIVEEIVAAVA